MVVMQRLLKNQQKGACRDWSSGQFLKGNDNGKIFKKESRVWLIVTGFVLFAVADTPVTWGVAE
jgi:hypothetical protein